MGWVLRSSVLSLLWGCGGGGEPTESTPEPSNAVVTAVEVHDLPDSVHRGQTHLLRVLARNRNGHLVGPLVLSVIGADSTTVPRGRTEYRLGDTTFVRIEARREASTELVVRADEVTARRPLTVHPARLERIVLQNDWEFLYTTDTMRFRPTVYNSANELVLGTPVTWSVSDSTVISVDTAGLVTALRPERQALLYIQVGRLRAEVKIETMHRSPYRVTISPASLQLQQDRSALIGATITDWDHFPMEFLGDYQWLTGDPARLTVAAEPGGGRQWRVTARDTGRFTIRVGGPTFVSTETVVRVLPNPVRSISLLRSAQVLEVGARLRAVAETRDAQDIPTPSRTVRWHSSNPSVATVSDSGEITALALGVTTITVSCEAVSVTFPLTVTPVRSVARVHVASEALTLVAGQRTFLPAMPTDSISTALPGRGVRWASETPAIVAVDSEGWVSAISAGTGTLRVSSDTASTRLSVRVIPATAASATAIEIRPIGPLEGEVERAFARAVARMRDIVDMELPDVAVRLEEEECHPSAPATEEVVDDLLVYVSVTSLPRGVLGGASVCWSRAESRLPVVASILLNSLEIPLLVQEGLLDVVVQHELMHALGFSRATFEGLKFGAGLATSDPRFIGPEASAAYRAIPGRAELDASPPLENIGGSGTREHHWRWSLLAPELMSSFLSLRTFTPLSTLTVAALADLGYRVRATGDDFRLLPLPAATARVGGPRMIPLIEQHRPGRGYIDRAGRKQLVQ